MCSRIFKICFSSLRLNAFEVDQKTEKKVEEVDWKVTFSKGKGVTMNRKIMCCSILNFELELFGPTKYPIKKIHFHS